MEKAEGESIINNFCKNNLDFKIMPIEKSETLLQEKKIYTKEGFLRLLPTSLKFSKHQFYNGTDGFFSAILKRVSG